jgi:dTDP-D-glucose 4,6-dehydratase
MATANSNHPEIIPKFSCLLQRGQPVVLHGDGTPTRRYLFAGDAADAFDTILHKGSIGQVYNVGSYDEISNLTLCAKLLSYLNIPHSTQEELHKWVKHTHDRPFNDHRYAVDGTKLRNLGWEQKTSFEDGLAITVDWYRRFGERWWGDISKVLTPFPTVAGTEVIASSVVVEEVKDDMVVDSHDNMTLGKKRKLNGTSHQQAVNV